MESNTHTEAVYYDSKRGPLDESEIQKPPCEAGGGEGAPSTSPIHPRNRI